MVNQCQRNLFFEPNLEFTADIEGIAPVFSVSTGSEVLFVDFEEFKRLTN